MADGRCVEKADALVECMCCLCLDVHACNRPVEATQQQLSHQCKLVYGDHLLPAMLLLAEQCALSNSRGDKVLLE